MTPKFINFYVNPLQNDKHEVSEISLQTNSNFKTKLKSALSSRHFLPEQIGEVYPILPAVWSLLPDFSHFAGNSSIFPKLQQNFV